MNFKKIVAALVVVFAVFCVISLGKIGEDVKNETIVVNQYPFTGNMEYWTSPGFHCVYYLYKKMQNLLGKKFQEEVRQLQFL